MKNYESIFRDSYARTLGNTSYNADFIGEFYRHFLSSSEEVADLFAHTNMSAQKTMLHDSLEYMLDFYATKKLSPQLEHLARVHGRSQHNVPLHLYDLWLDSLMISLKQCDDQFHSDVELSWRLVLAPGIAYLKYMYKH